MYLTRFFSKSKPVNFTVVAVFMTAVFAGWWVADYSTGTSTVGWPLAVVMLPTYLFGMLVLDFMVRKNHLTRNSSHRIALYALFTAIFPQTFSDPNLLFSNLFVLLSLRRSLALQSKKEVSKKVFDAALWIGVAALFWFWALLFLIPLFTMIKYSGLTDRFRCFWIVLTGLATVLVLANVYTLLTQDVFFNPVLGWQLPDASGYTVEKPLELLPQAIVLLIFLWAGIQYYRYEKRKGKRPLKNKLILLLTYTAWGVVTLSGTNHTGAYAFFAFPFAVLVSNYLDTPGKQYLRELLLWLLIGLAVWIIVQ